MTNLSEKAKRRMEIKEIDKNLRKLFYELSNYPNWILNPENSSGNNISNIKNWCIGIDDLEIKKVKNRWRYPDLEMDMDLVEAKIMKIPFSIGGFEYNDAGFEAIRIVFFIRNKLIIDVVINESYSQRREDFGEIWRIVKYHESDEMEEVLKNLSVEVEKKWDKFWKIKNKNKKKFIFNN
jgi:hypothetical protein